MDKQTVDVVNLSLGRCLLKEKEFMEAFYNTFTNADARFAPMFANTDMKKQFGLLKSGLTFLLMSAGGSSFADREIEKLGVLHDDQHLKIAPEMYPIWTKSLLKTVKEFDKEITPDLLAKWEATLKEGIKKMADVFDSKASHKKSS